ncbi:MAG: 3-deoxy-D-manno-octulosonate 8-phosphate phosphatase [Candidatus Zixiibacteriota bacterium]
MQKIQMLIFDFDGVLTDNYVYLTERGERIKRFWVPDGVGVFMAHRAGIKMAIITGNEDGSTRHRAEYLRISDVFQGVRDKVAVYEGLLHKYRLSDSDCLFIGDDLPDREIFRRRGLLTLAPPDAHPEILRLARWVGTMPGGRGIVREAIDALLAARMSPRRSLLAGRRR